MTNLPPQTEEKRIRFFSPYKSLFQPDWDYLVYYGGRGSAKSWSVGRALLVRAAQERRRVLCAREYQNSIADSVHRLLTDQIDAMELPGFRITNKSIESATGSEFLFKGIRHNIKEIKSTEGVDDCWVEEAETVSQDSWDILLPTVFRKDKSRLIITFNPEDEENPTWKQFVATQRPKSIVTEVNYTENPCLPEKLRDQMEWCKKTDYEAYEHIWLGKPKKRSKATIFGGKYSVSVFETPKDVDRFFFGADWGFSDDPSTLIRCFIKNNTLFIDHEAWEQHVEFENYPDMYVKVPGSATWPIKADNSRPETISAVRRRGYNIEAARKWPGSVEDGISYLRSFDQIVIHERCVHMREEARLYSYKVDKTTKEVLPTIVDKWNHCWDAVRYALDGYIKKDGGFAQSEMY
jgi:phage terminase large subunit